jgi:hypothetical protein
MTSSTSVDTVRGQTTLIRDHGAQGLAGTYRGGEGSGGITLAPTRRAGPSDGRRARMPTYGAIREQIRQALGAGAGERCSEETLNHLCMLVHALATG